MKKLEDFGFKVFGYSDRHYEIIDGNKIDILTFEKGAICPDTDEWDELITEAVIDSIGSTLFELGESYLIIRRNLDKVRHAGQTRISCRVGFVNKYIVEENSFKRA